MDAAHNALGPTIYGSPNDDFVKLADRTAEPVQDARVPCRALAAGGSERSGVRRPGAEVGQLSQVLESNLTDLKLFRFGTIDISVMGRRRAGRGRRDLSDRPSGAS